MMALYWLFNFIYSVGASTRDQGVGYGCLARAFALAFDCGGAQRAWLFGAEGRFAQVWPTARNTLAARPAPGFSGLMAQARRHGA
jgi:hypothetical protein